MAQTFGRSNEQSRLEAILASAVACRRLVVVKAVFCARTTTAHTPTTLSQVRLRPTANFVISQTEFTVVALVVLIWLPKVVVLWVATVRLLIALGLARESCKQGQWLVKRLLLIIAVVLDLVLKIAALFLHCKRSLWRQVSPRIHNQRHGHLPDRILTLRLVLTFVNLDEFQKKICLVHRETFKFAFLLDLPDFDISLLL